MIIDYTAAVECSNPEVVYTCYQCGKCGRERRDGMTELKRKMTELKPLESR